MMHSSSECNFKHVSHSSQKLLDEQTSKNHHDEEVLNIFASKQGNYAKYKINDTIGNQRFHRSEALQHNHSSAIMYLNDGSRGETYNKTISLSLSNICKLGQRLM